MFLVTHDPLEALRLGHRIQVMAGQPARIEEPICPAGTPPRDLHDPALLARQGDLLARLAEPKSRRLSNPRPLLVLAGLLLLWQGVGGDRHGALPLPPPLLVDLALLDRAALLADHAAVTLRDPDRPARRRADGRATALAMARGRRSTWSCR